jgi:hypothetical protein
LINPYDLKTIRRTKASRDLLTVAWIAANYRRHPLSTMDIIQALPEADMGKLFKIWETVAPGIEKRVRRDMAAMDAEDEAEMLRIAAERVICHTT